MTLVERHAILRTSFVWERVEKPHQVVRRQVRLDFERHDLRGLNPSEQEKLIQSCTEEQRKKVFSLSKPPLMRLALIAIADHRYRLVWTFHHIILE